MDSLRKYWENPKFRMTVVCIIASPFIYILFTKMFLSRSYVPLAERIEQKQQEDRVDDKGRVVGLFDTGQLQDLEADEFKDIYNQSVGELQKREANLYKERDSMNLKFEQMAQLMDQQALQIKELQRSQKVGYVSKNQRDSRRTRNNRQQERNSNNAGGPNTYIASTPMQPGPGIIDNTQINLISAKPQIEGKVIRTITQRTVRSIKKTGEIEETDYKNTNLTQSGDKSALERMTESLKNEGGLVDSDEGVVYLPSGSFFSGVLLTGLDAPTQLAARKSPMPVVIRIKKEAILPNGFSLDLRECHVIGSAVGDLSSERAYIRAASITCVREDGRSVEAKLQADAISDYDGKLGIAGRMVSKNGNLLAGSMAAGFMSGMANAVAPQKSLSISTSSGASPWEAIDVGSVATAGLLQGSSDAMARLADYYIALAEQIHPVIEISPGRSISFVVLKGTKLRLGNSND